MANAFFKKPRTSCPPKCDGLTKKPRTETRKIENGINKKRTKERMSILVMEAKTPDSNTYISVIASFFTVNKISFLFLFLIKKMNINDPVIINLLIGDFNTI